MKIKSFLGVGLILLALIACNDDLKDEKDDNINGKTYVTLQFGMNGRRDGRATPPVAGGDGKETGTLEESKVTSALFVAYSAEGGALVKSEKIVTFEEEVGSTVNNPYIYTAREIEIAQGAMHFYVVVNPPEDYIAPTTEENFLKTQLPTNDPTAEFSEKGKFLMSNSKKVGGTVTAEHTKMAPLEITIPVDRVVAKIEYWNVKEGNVYTVPSAADSETANLNGEITFQSADIINLMKETYLFKTTKKEGEDPKILDENWKEGEGSGSYVVDPYFLNKKGDFEDGEYSRYYTNSLINYKFNGKYSFLKGEVDKKEFEVYCLENTSDQENQKNGYSTGIVFKAQYKPAGEDKVTDLYRCNGQLYTSWNDFIRDYSDLKDLTEDEYTDRENLALLGIDYFKDGICYYTYWIRHINNDDPETMGEMEFGIVRNNIYRLKIMGVNNIGEPTVPTDPENPNEGGKSYLNVRVEILPWTLRLNEIEF